MLKKLIQEQEIIKFLQNYYGLSIQALQPIWGGADLNALAYRVDTKSNSYFVKFNYGNHDEINLSIIGLLHGAGLHEIIFPITTMDGKLFQQLDGFRIVVYPFIEAPNGFTQDLTVKQWKQLGMALRKIHETSVPSSIHKQIRKEAYSAKWRKMLRSFYDKIEPHIADDEITADFKSFFNQNSGKIHRLVDGADELSKKIPRDPDEFVLCHSDIHAGNVLLSNENIYIIDWDEPMLAPKERDQMFIGGGVGNVWNNPHEIEGFYQGYGDTNINQAILSYYRHERIVEDIALYTKDLLSQEQNNQSRLEMLKHFKDMFHHNGVVDIAFGGRSGTEPV